jgi:hypothetical protein
MSEPPACSFPSRHLGVVLCLRAGIWGRCRMLQHSKVGGGGGGVLLYTRDQRGCQNPQHASFLSRQLMYFSFSDAGIGAQEYGVNFKHKHREVGGGDVEERILYTQSQSLSAPPLCFFLYRQL